MKSARNAGPSNKASDELHSFGLIACSRSSDAIHDLGLTLAFTGGQCTHQQASRHCLSKDKL